MVFETIDALGGQVKDEDTVLDEIDWGKVNGSTGPVYVEDARPGDTLVVEVLDIKVDDRGVMVVVPGHGALGEKRTFKPKVKARPMIGTIGVAPASEEIPCGSLGRHGGNMDVKKLCAGTKLYLPVFVEGALPAMP
ncbi:MAG: acetamidase/formamidase family protein [Thermoproteales archaeon]|nr:acetamidase/formamidase family protein [Thermoproteales archaeon]